MYNAMDVANYIVNKSIKIDSPVSNLKLQKLLYYVQAAALVDGGCESGMFKDNISAWKYGPVVEVVYHKFKIYANASLKTDGSIVENCIKEEHKELIDKVIDAYKDVGAVDLVRKTHNEDPWKDAYDRRANYINLDEIKTYYSKNRELLYA